MTEKPKRGRPVEKPMPEPIPDTPENIMRAVLATPPKRDDGMAVSQAGGLGPRALRVVTFVYNPQKDERISEIWSPCSSASACVVWGHRTRPAPPVTRRQRRFRRAKSLTEACGGRGASGALFLAAGD